ncbi:MAG: SDR family NAD(P)-dependent oxidoreductase [Bryobacteraceae bacterium]
MALNPMDLAGRRILVTGASSGIGRETAILLSELNARLALSGRHRDRLNQTLLALQGEGHVAAPFDLNNLDDCGLWLKNLTIDGGPFHGLVHCAGVRHTIPLRSTTLPRLEESLRVNYTSAVMLAKAFRQPGCSAPGSSIVLLSSVAAMAGEAGLSAYGASKAALIGLTKSLAMEFSRDGVRVNCVAPGFVESEMLERFREMLMPEQLEAVEKAHPLGFGRTRDVANAVAFLLAETGRWITGTVLVVDGGYTAH